MPQQLAKVERENIHVMLDANGNQLSWLQIYPRFKIDKEGDRVLSGAEMYLKVAERSNEYLHSADRPPLPGHHREVNCALEQTSWRLKRYQSSTDSVDPNYLLASQLVLISDPETRSNLTIARPPLGALDNAVALDKPQHIHSSGDLGALADLSSSNPLHSNVSSPTLGQHEYIHPYGDMVLEPIPPQDVVDSNHLWFIEAGSILDGGPIRWKTDLVRFKHMNTGQYLAHTEEYPVNEETGEQEEVLIFTTTSHPNTPGTLFNVNELNSTGKLLSNGKALQIGQAGSWIERGDVSEDSVLTFMVRGTHDRANALSLMIHRAGGHNAASNAAAGDDDHSEVIAAHEPLDFFSGLAARNYLRRYHDMTVIPRSDSVNTIWPTAIRTDLEFFQLVVEKTVFFSQGFPIASTGIQLGIDKADAVLRTKRQNLLREQNTLEVVLRMINKLIPITEKLERMKKTDAHHQKKKKPTFSEQEQQMVAMGQLVLGKCFNLLYYTILDNQENQMYVADYMPFLLAHLNVQPLAGKCVTEMLSKNIELQETKIGTREIQIFVEKLRSSKMNAMYLQLLQACCSCEGQGVDGNQCKVANMLFSDKSDIIISMMEHEKRPQEGKWQMPSLYIPGAPIAGSPVEGDDLLHRLPLLSITWTTNSIEFSPLGLFGKLSVNIQELFRKKLFDALEDTKEVGRKAKSSKRKASNDQKEAVANYFIAEMFLAAEMCMDRNYVAINKLNEDFTYRRLVTILKLDVNSQIKSAAVRLLMCLHVDRDPQAASKIPLLTRTWSDIKKNTEPQLPYVEASRRYKFGLVQQLISEHVQNMAGVRWDELSWHMLRMLRTLAQFNFYGTNERMTDLIGPLIKALDRRSLVVEVESAPTKLRGRKKKTKEMESEAAMKRLQDAAQASAQTGDSINQNDETNNEEKYETENIDATFDDQEAQLEPWYMRLVSGCRKVMCNLMSLNQTARIGVAEDEGETATVEGYRVPLRYSKAPIYELDTMVEAVDILAFAQRVIEDRNISLLLRYFYAWESGADKRTPSEIFEQVVQDSKELSLNLADFDNIMLDVLMFVHMPLTQSTLEVLMAHHSMRRILLDNAKNVQLLASPSRERLFKQVDQMLQQLEQNAETHELWGELETDKHHQDNQQTKGILMELIDHCRVRRSVLEFDEDFQADAQIQDLYRNLGCFEICMKVMGLLDSVEEDEDGNLSEVALNTKDLCLKCNTLLYWYFLGNPKNQEQGFKELDLFLDTLDSGINSHLVIKAIFKNNEQLMRQVPFATLDNLIEKVCKNGKSHHYLSLFASISHVGERNIKENQFEIVKTLTSPGRLAKVACYLCPVDHPDYQEKREQMRPFLDETRDLSLDDLPPLLAYHLMFLEVMSGCTVGKLNVTTVEAKVQSVFNNQDIVASILDPDTILVAKVIMSKFLYNAVIEVELVIPGLERSLQVWKLLDSYQKVLGTAKEEFVNAAKLGWESPQVSRQRLEYIIISMMIIGGFFGHYYESSNFRGTDPGRGSDKTRFMKSDANRLIVAFFHKIKEVYDLDSPLLSEEMKIMMNNTLDTLKKHGSKYIHVPVIPRMQRSLSVRSGNSSPVRGMTPLGGSRPTSSGNLMTPLGKPGTAATAPSSPSKGSPAKRAKEESERRLIEKYNEFLDDLASNQPLQDKADNENVAFITLLESLPFIKDEVQADVRYETLIRKLVFHIRENIKIVNGQKRLDARVTKTSTWIMKAFRTMIENKMGMSIFERDEEGGAEEDERAEPVVNALNSCGGTALCLDLIADGIDGGLQMEAVRLGVGLLFKEGGALEVQKFMHNHLQKTQSDLFFKQVRMTLSKLQEDLTFNGQVELGEGEEPKHPPQILILRFLQLMCEGHFLPNQDIMREQPTNATSYNLLDDFVSLLNSLSRMPCRTSTMAAIRLSATILEVIQGPCEGNQAHFALSTELVETLNRLNRAKMQLDCLEGEETDLKKTCIDIFQGLLEGQGEKSVVYDRVLSVIHLDIILMMSKQDAQSEDQVILQTECVVLLQMLCNYKPTLYDELGISRNIEDIVGSGTAMIEVVWRGDIHRRFFHVPTMCSYLAKSSKDALVENVDRTNAENKLIDFLARSHELYREAKHQQWLTDFGLAHVFSRANQNIATWVTFYLTILINILFIASYSQQDGHPEISAQYNQITFYINILQALVSMFTLLLWAVVKSPVIYESAMEANGGNRWDAIQQTAQDPLTVYYVVYLIISVLGVTVDNYYCSLLLLDIVVKNSVTRDVLMAIVTPGKQLVMALLLEIFVIYIFSFFIVSYNLDISCITHLHSFT
jgi:hypothetical protein